MGSTTDEEFKEKLLWNVKREVGHSSLIAYLTGLWFKLDKEGSVTLCHLLTRGFPRSHWIKRDTPECAHTQPGKSNKYPSYCVSFDSYFDL